MTCYPHEHLAPNSARLEVSKKVLNFDVPKGAVKLQDVKVLVLEKSKVFIGGTVVI